MSRYRWIFDPGHSWLEVPEATVEALRVRVSSYSPRRDGMVYLEEDCDAAAFLAAVTGSKDYEAMRAWVRANTVDVEVERFER